MKTFKFKYKNRIVTVKAINKQVAEMKVLRKINKNKNIGLSINEISICY